MTVTGDFNDWQKQAHPLHPHSVVRDLGGLHPQRGARCLSTSITSSRTKTATRWKSPIRSGCFTRVPPESASVVWDLDYQWSDNEWMAQRGSRQRLDAPISIYEVHLGSWRRVLDEGHRSLNYRELAIELRDHVKRLGFTHVEFLPVMEHPLLRVVGLSGDRLLRALQPLRDAAGLQKSDRLPASGRDRRHPRLGAVALFPSDEHGLARFDGTHLFEHADPRQGHHPDWDSAIFNYGRNEVRSFLMSNALFWLDEYHADGLRVDAVASMLYLDYSRKEGEWIPNVHGGRENLEAIDFLRTFNTEVYKRHPDVHTFAEESTDWPMVSRPTYLGGLGFGMKWDMGWMHDTLKYMSHDPVHRRYPPQ